MLITISSAVLLSLGHYYMDVYAASVKDPNLKVQLLTVGLNSPTSMAFLGPDDILVLEKDGKVQRVVGGHILQHPALDITSIVNSSGERGLLGIAISHEVKDTEENGADKNGPKIYLLYTRKITNNDANDCLYETCKTNKDVVNSLYRYNIKDGNLINGKLLINLPVGTGESFVHLGGAIILGPDNNVYITSGDGTRCHNSEECKMITKDDLYSQTTNIINGTRASGGGGILYVTANGKVANLKGILGDDYPLNIYFAYGIRNSFGIDFDPVTGNLWDTENGPFFGDEINLVKPGFNSGWSKVQGIWPITNYSQLASRPPPGLPKGYYIPIYGPETNEGNLFDFNGNGKYSKPEFTWNSSEGVTSIKFFNSDKLGEKYKNDMFVGTIDQRFIYHFDLNEDRKGLLLKGELNDNIANNENELRDIIFVRGPRGVTDLEVGPDGFLYVLSIGEGTIYKITPK
jgi:glucose/arabinose dehydrogenase